MLAIQEALFSSLRKEKRGHRGLLAWTKVNRRNPAQCLPAAVDAPMGACWGCPQVFGVAVASVGLASFALVLALVEQIVLEVIESNVKRGSSVYEAGHVGRLALDSRASRCTCDPSIPAGMRRALRPPALQGAGLSPTNVMGRGLPWELTC